MFVRLMPDGFGTKRHGRMLYVFWKERLFDAAKSWELEGKPPSSAKIESAIDHPRTTMKMILVTSWHAERTWYGRAEGRGMDLEHRLGQQHHLPWSFVS